MNETIVCLKAIKIFLSVSLLVAAVVGCSRQRDASPGKVHIQEKNGKYTLYRDGKPFYIKGASGDAHFDALKRAGGNTVRVWDTLNLAKILDSAAANEIAVVVGLPVFNSDYMAFYNSGTKVAKQHEAFKSVISRFKKHPAVLMWCIGNELDFPHKPAYLNFYKAFNDLTEMIHREDPDHPVTTTVLNFNSKNIFNINARCNVDLISFNIFGRLSFLRDELKGTSLFWNGPFMLAEWGINGPWDGTEQTAWGAYIEDTSTKKAELYLERYKTYMPVDNPRFLGAFAFFWGNKQEGTHTWFSMFDENGAESEVVSALQYIWTGKKDAHSFPQVKYMLLDKKGARDNIILSPGNYSSAEVLMLEKAKIKTVKWQIFKEDWYKKNKIHSTKKLKPIEGLIGADQGLSVNFKAPAEEGPYRIFAAIYDENGHFSTANTPFYVITDK
ncbi:hypothetical protein ABIE26_001854 [Pedobacter africanus]